MKGLSCFRSQVRFVHFTGLLAAAPAILVWNAAQLSLALSSFLKIAAATVEAQGPYQRRRQ